MNWQRAHTGPYGECHRGKTRRGPKCAEAREGTNLFALWLRNRTLPVLALAVPAGQLGIPHFATGEIRHRQPLLCGHHTPGPVQSGNGHLNRKSKHADPKWTSTRKQTSRKLLNPNLELRFSSLPASLSSGCPSLGCFCRFRAPGNVTVLHLPYSASKGAKMLYRRTPPSLSTPCGRNERRVVLSA